MGSADTTGSSLFSATFEPCLREEDAAWLAGWNPDGLQELLGYRFKDRGLLEEALCHASFAHEHGLALSNQRLEFLGDSVLGFLVARVLYERHPRATEGELSRMRSSLVCGASLCRQAEALGVAKVLLRGRSMRGRPLPPSLCEDALEALIGAVCLDGGIAEAERVVRRLFFGGGEGQGEQAEPTDAKSRLQILLQAQDGGVPRYEVVSVSGPSHSPRFQVQLRAGRVESLGCGASRREAEAAAAERALQKLGAVCAGAGEEPS